MQSCNVGCSFDIHTSFLCRQWFLTSQLFSDQLKSIQASLFIGNCGTVKLMHARLCVISSPLIFVTGSIVSADARITISAYSMGDHRPSLVLPLFPFLFSHRQLPYYKIHARKVVHHLSPAFCPWLNHLLSMRGLLSLHVRRTIRQLCTVLEIGPKVKHLCHNFHVDTALDEAHQQDAPLSDRIDVRTK